MIFVSTGGQRKETAVETAIEYINNDIRFIELSGGKYSPTYLNDLLELSQDAIFQVHNYFPPPEIPFVFNLASTNQEIARKSLFHVRQAIQLAARLDRKTYSFHAGFRIDPHVGELGQQLRKQKLLSRQAALDLFGDRVAMLAEEAKLEGVSLLVENNVINRKNLEIFGEDPLLLTDPNEMSWFMENCPSDVGLLLDVAHLKVSANTRSFNMVEAHEQVKRWVKGYHLSDNDGSKDTNYPISEESWFWHYIIPGLDYYSLEVYNQPICKLLEQKMLTQKMLEKLGSAEI